MAKVQGSIRPLFYPLNRSEDTNSQTPNENVTYIDLSQWPTNDPDERIEIVLSVSLNEYVALANSIDVGRDIAYGNNSMEIWWIWIRAVMSLSICQSMIECIETTPELQSLIQNTVNGLPQTGGQQNRIDSSAFESISCDKDAMYGYSLALWNYINANNIDALQIVAEATNVSEQLSKILTSVIPGLELLPVDEILGWVEAFGNYNLEAYEASITVGLEEQIVCDLFCIAVNNGCTLDFGQVYGYFVEKMGGVNIPTATATLLEWIQFMVIGSYPTDRIVYLWSAFQLGLAFMGQQFLGLSTIGRYSIIAQTGDPDSDWQLLCTDCFVCELPISIDFEDGTAGECGTIDDGEIVSSPAIGSFSLAKTSTSGFSDPTLDISIANPNVRNVQATWWHYFSPLSSRDVTIQIRAFNSLSQQIGIDSDVIFTITGTWTQVTMSLLGLSEDVSFVQIKSSLGSGVTPLTVAIDDITVIDPTA